jgi:hypothetical protein
MTSNPTPRTGAATWPQRLSDGLLITIVLSVGVMAGAASFNHVHDWTMDNSPAHTAGWFGWANAVITELIPTAALIIIARRRRTRGPIRYPMFLLIIAVSLSLTAQLAVAVPTVFGWMVSALPAAAFFALSKLVFTATPAPSTADPAPARAATAEALHQSATRVHHLETRPTPGPALTPAADAATPSPEVPAAAPARPAAKKTTASKPSQRRIPATKTTPAKKAPARAPIATAEADERLPIAVPEPASTATFLPEARIIAQAHHAAHGQPITAGILAQRLQVTPTTAEDILTALGSLPTAPNTQPHNGTEVPA